MTTKRKKKAITKAKKRAKKQAPRKIKRASPAFLEAELARARNDAYAWELQHRAALALLARALGVERPSKRADRAGLRAATDFLTDRINIVVLWEGFARAAIGRLALAKHIDRVQTMTIAELAQAVEETDTVHTKVNAAINVITNDAASFDDTKEAIRVLRAMLQIAGPLAGSSKLASEDNTTAVIESARVIESAPHYTKGEAAEGLALLEALDAVKRDNTLTMPPLVCMLIEKGYARDIAEHAAAKAIVGLLAPKSPPASPENITPEANDESPQAKAADEEAKPVCFNCSKPCTTDNFCYGCKSHVCDACDVASFSGDGLTGSHDVKAHLVDE